MLRLNSERGGTFVRIVRGCLPRHPKFLMLGEEERQRGSFSTSALVLWRSAFRHERQATQLAPAEAEGSMPHPLPAAARLYSVFLSSKLSPCSRRTK